MVFGHNTNLKVGDVTFHVQTEDRGESHALIDTTVYYRGRVLHRRTNNYFDLLPMNEDRQQALKLRLEDQHRSVIEQIRSGELQLTIPHAAEPVASPISSEPAGLPREQKKLLLTLTNANSWLSGKNATLQIALRDEKEEPVPGAQIHVEVEGSENRAPIQSQTGPTGQALIKFEMPRITGPQGALVIRAESNGLTGHLRFALRAKPRVA